MTKDDGAASWLQASIQAIINVELKRFERMLRFVTFVERVIGRTTRGKLTTSSPVTLTHPSQQHTEVAMPHEEISR